MAANKEVVEIELQPGYWQFVTHSEEGYGYSIYPTRACGAEHLDQCKEQHPQHNFRVRTLKLN